MKNLFEHFDSAFENKVRLGIMSVLMVNENATFNFLKEMLEVTDGNLASHLKYLEREGYISVRKRFVHRKPNTTYFVTATGKESFEKHLEVLEKILKMK